MNIPNIRYTISFILAATVFLESLAYGQNGGNPEINFAVTREGEFIQTEARVDLPVSPAVAWAVLTDYERYPRFISSMRQSRIVSRNTEGLIVEQKGRFSFLFFSQEIDVRLQVSEFPAKVVESRAIDGDFRVMNGRYELIPRGNSVRLSYSGRLAPNFGLPPIFGLRIVRYILFRNFSEMVNEILRRDAATKANPTAG